MIISALITKCRREYADIPKSAQAIRAGDGASTLFNLGRYPVMENSYSIYFGTSAKNEVSDYNLDKDSGDLVTVLPVTNGVQVKANFKYAVFRDQNWVEAINYGIDALNGRGFFRQVVRSSTVIQLSAGVRTYAGPSGCIDIYAIEIQTPQSMSANYSPLGGNWSYQQDANKLTLGDSPTQNQSVLVSYLRNLQTYQSTSATLDSLNDWVEGIQLKAGEYHARYFANYLMKQGNANIDEGHFSYTNVMTMMNGLNRDFEQWALRKKPTRPSKRIAFFEPAAGPA